MSDQLERRATASGAATASEYYGELASEVGTRRLGLFRGGRRCSLHSWPP